MSKHIFEKKNIWETYFSLLLLDLAYDKISKVRISLNKFLFKVINKNKYDYLKFNDTIKNIYSILKKDIKEISSIIEKLDIEIVNINLNINVNDKFTHNMSFFLKNFVLLKMYL